MTEYKKELLDKRSAEQAENVIASIVPFVTSTSGRTTLGPFVITYSMTKDEAKVDVSVRLGPLKTRILSATLTRRKNSASGSASAKLVKASIEITADFDKMQLRIRGEACHKKLNGKWRCKGLSAKIG